MAGVPPNYFQGALPLSVPRLQTYSTKNTQKQIVFCFFDVDNSLHIGKRNAKCISGDRKQGKHMFYNGFLFPRAKKTQKPLFSLYLLTSKIHFTLENIMPNAFLETENEKNTCFIMVFCAPVPKRHKNQLFFVPPCQKHTKTCGFFA